MHRKEENMKTIRLLSLTLDNFRCYDHLDLDFGGRDVTIYGDNASGKTSIYDGLTWLLFGKDALGGSGMEVKPLGPDGDVKDHMAVTQAYGVLEVDGEKRSFRRTYHEIWNGKDGSFGGNTSEFYADGVPCRKSEYAKKVGELVQEDTFRMLTAVTRFSGEIPWQKRREILFDLAGLGKEEELLSLEERFAPLDRQRGRLSLSDFEKKIRLEKKNLTAARDDIPVRISELETSLQRLGRPDFGALRELRKALLQEQKELLSQSDPMEAVRLRIRETEEKLHRLESENGYEKQSFQQQEDQLRSVLLRLRCEEKRLEDSEIPTGEIEKLQEKIRREEALPFAGTVCPFCGQPLEGAALQKAKNQFIAEKSRKIQGFNDEIRRILQQEEQRQKRLGVLQQDRRPVEEKLSALREKGKEQQGRFDLLRQGLQAELSRLRQESAGRDGNARKEAELEQDLENLDRELSKEEVIASMEKRLQELRQDADRKSQRILDIDRQLSLLGEFTRFKIRFVEEGINGHFQLAECRLFRRQVDGTLEPRCDVTYQGVPYYDLNTGARINLGLDIIRTLSAHYGVTVPLFLDNGESVTRLLPGAGQVIRLVVSEKDPVIRME